MTPVIIYDEPVYSFTRTLESGDPLSGTTYSEPVIVTEQKVTMDDFVVPDFRKRQAKGEIFNNPLKTVKVSKDTPLVPFDVIQEFKSPYNSGSYHSYGTFVPNNLSDVAFSIEPDIESMERKAITRAYGNVSANEGNSALWLGELKETISGMYGLGKSIEKLVKLTADQRKKWAKGQLTVKEAQSLTLAILYGIVPLEQQINDFMEGLFQLKPSNSRATARGFEVSSEEIYIFRTIGSFDGCDIILEGTESAQVQARAGVLFDVDTTDFPSMAIVFDPKQVVSTMYALARLSFVLEWFINIGSTLKAWTPSYGTTILSAWLTLEVTREFKGRIFLRPRSWTNPEAWHAVSGSGTSDISLKDYTKLRNPIDRSDLAVLPRFDIDLNLDKIFALTLLFAKSK